MPVITKRSIVSRSFRLYRNHAGQWWLKCLVPKVAPKARRISSSSANYLFDCGREFDNACVLDFGVGVFQKVF